MADGSTGGLLGKLLMPGFTDAGASTTFKSIAIAEPDQVSEVATEIHDNRTSTLLHYREQQQQINEPSIGSGSGSKPDTEEANRQRGSSSDYSFFPSTKPLSTNSPRPASPPMVTRRQLPMTASSVAGTSVVPVVGAYEYDIQLEEQENQQRFQFWKSEEMDDTDSAVEGGKKTAMLNEENLKRSELENAETESTDDSSKGPNRDSSLLIEEEENDYRNDNENENDNASEVVSDALSTASEMGTIINIGSTRMADIDAMAALMEASPNIDLARDPPTAHYGNGAFDSGLALPLLLETKSFDRPNVLSQSKTKDDPHLDLPHGANATTHPLHAPNPSTSAIVTAAIRRIGSGLTKSMSAPPTPKTPGIPPPPRVEDLLKSTLAPRSNPRDHDDLPPSFALRSPGSSARYSLSHQKGALLTPRFSSAAPSAAASRQHQSIHRTPQDNPTITPRRDNAQQNSNRPPQMSPNMLLPGFRLAQKCFSFDSTLDEGTTDQQQLPDRRTQYNGTAKPLAHSQSWDASSSAFRAQPYRSHGVGGLRNTASQDEQRIRLNSDFSPTKHSTQQAMELQTPQRIEIEREDALDILACLVERGVSAWNIQDGKDDGDTSSDVSATESLIASMTEELRKVNQDTDKDQHSKRMAALDELLKSHAYALEMKRAALSASTWLKSIGRGRTEDALPVMPDPSQLGPISEGGQASGEDDKSISKSVSTSSGTTDSSKMEILTLKAMLHSAQMEVKGKTEAAQKMDKELSKCRAEIGRLKTASRAEHASMTQNRSVLDDEPEETESTGQLAKTIDRSKDSPPSPIAETGSDTDGNNFFDESYEGNNSLFQGMSEEEQKERLDEADQLDVLVMKTALQRANETICRLHNELHKDSGEADEPAPVVAIPDVSPKESAQQISKSVSSPEEHRMINVRMLDGENFVTEWDDLTPPLPPPPDHGLRSPIVSAVLEQWTRDRALHDSLCAWIERVMTGDDLESVPPLTISSLDHQVRDGFSMHVLPLLLRRADIHVAVQTRAHRRTTYDMAVTVRQKPHGLPMGNQSIPIAPMDQQRPGSLLDQHSQDEWAEKFNPPVDVASSVAHSAATEKIVNGGGRYNTNFRNHDDTEYSHFGILHSASGEIDEMQQQGIMGALGGALGGLLSRRKYSASSPSRFHHEAGSALPAALRASIDLTSSPVASAYRGEEEDQPYHRVVSAPPGRIGVTFVEFRGHAMVSDVAPDSPLSSWVFPSDILIAIDEIPVSGMRVRDIIKVLTNRRDRQRALRVISSHAMNEFTLNQSVLNDAQP